MSHPRGTPPAARTRRLAGAVLLVWLGGALAVGSGRILVAAAGRLEPPAPSPAAAPASQAAQAIPPRPASPDVPRGPGGTGDRQHNPPVADRFLVGAAKVSIAPRPDPARGEVWITEGCRTLGEDAPSAPAHAADTRVWWPENPGCIYMGGYGIGPLHPVRAFDPEYGLWVRAVAVGDGRDTVVLAVLDGVEYFGTYARLCQGCGFFDLARELGRELGIDPAGFLFASTHSHTAPDFAGAWGGVPGWYMRQVADAIRQAVRQAVASMRPAVLEAGEEWARRYNAERRDFYRSAEDPALTWFRAVAAGRKREVIATVGVYAAHPVTVDPEAGIAHADWPGVFARRLEERFGGVGLAFVGGLGNMSPRGGTEEIGRGLADLIPAVGRGRPVRGGDVRVLQTFWDQPVTNSGLLALGAPGFFDRPFQPVPAAVRVGKDERRPCTSAAPVSVRTAVSVARLGDLWITGAPGEQFANLTNTIKERAPGIALTLSQVNDGLGYVLQSFEQDPAGRQGLGFTGTVAEYEEAYSLDACFGDMVLETILDMIGRLSRE